MALFRQESSAGTAMSTDTATSLTIVGPETAYGGRVLTPGAMQFVAGLQREFGPTRNQLLARRRERWRQVQSGGTLDFLPETESVRSATWRVAPAPKDLDDRRV